MTWWLQATFVGLSNIEKACTAQCKLQLFHGKTIVRDSCTNLAWRTRRNPISAIGEFLVRYFRFHPRTPNSNVDSIPDLHAQLLLCTASYKSWAWRLGTRLTPILWQTLLLCGAAGLHMLVLCLDDFCLDLLVFHLHLWASCSEIKISAASEKACHMWYTYNYSTLCIAQCNAMLLIIK